MRALLIVLDSGGCGAAPDADRYGDTGANTLGHILEAYPGLALPALDSLGLRAALAGIDGVMLPRSAGKDTTTGHWEIAGVILDQPFATFESFPPQLVANIEAEAGVQFLGNVSASGTAILEKLGAEHVATGHPILYTSADSVLQVAAHESVVPIERLYEICRIARRHADGHRIGRVIARPFLGVPGQFQRTSRRHDFSFLPPPTVLDTLNVAGIPVTGVGKIADIFADRGVTTSRPTESNADGLRVIDELWSGGASGLIFANLVDFDTLFGHRRDVAGYARALEEFDRWLTGFLPRVAPDDLVIITADHGNDPTFRGTDHTREQVPLLVIHPRRAPRLGVRTTFADSAATVADHFETQFPNPGTTCLIAKT